MGEGAVGTGNVANSNCVYNGKRGNIQSPTTGFTVSGNVTANPDYTNASTHTYTLQPGSPCLAVVGYDTAALIAASTPNSAMTTSATIRQLATETRSARAGRTRRRRDRAHGARSHGATH